MPIYWCGLPQFIWEAIANIIIALGAGMMIAFFTSTFLKKREERIRVSGVILEKRINAEQEVLSYIDNCNFKYEYPKDKQGQLLELLSIYRIELPYGSALQYSEIFTAPDKFEVYIAGLEKLISKNRLWMDKKVRQHLMFIQNYYVAIRMIPVMLHRIPLPSGHELTEEQYSRLHKTILWQYGIILDSEINGFVAELENLIVTSIYKLDLRRPRKSITRNLMNNSDMAAIQWSFNNKTILGREKYQFFEAICRLVEAAAGCEEEMNEEDK